MKGKRKCAGIEYFVNRTTPGAQLFIRVAFSTKEQKERVDIVITKWFYHAIILFNVI